MIDLRNLDDHNQFALDAYNLIMTPHLNGIACPECGEELRDSNPSVALTSWPPQFPTYCPACGYTGTRF